MLGLLILVELLTATLTINNQINNLFYGSTRTRRLACLRVWILSIIGTNQGLILLFAAYLVRQSSNSYVD